MVESKAKVVVIGAGFVGSSIAFAITMSGIASELVLIDVNKEKAFGEAMDINHGLSFVSQMAVYSGDYPECKDADVIVITAGANRKPGETRLDLAKKNAAIIKDVTANIMKYYNKGVLLVVSNPLDVITYLVTKWSGLPYGKVIGTGTVLDTSRFRYLLSQRCNVDVRNVHGYIIGEHGDSQIPVWSATNIAGINIDECCSMCKNGCPGIDKEAILDEVRQAGAKIIKNKGATYYGIALTAVRVIEALMKNQNSVLTVSSLINGYYGLSDVALSLPSIVNKNGLDRIFEIKLADEELKALHYSASQIKAVLSEVKDI